MKKLREELKSEILSDFGRAKNALESAKRNFDEGDILTSANRAFVACENAVYVLMKLKFGSTTTSRKRIALNMGSIDPALKELYDRAYDLRVQADYGRISRISDLNKETVRGIIEKVEKSLLDAENALKKAGIPA